MKGKGSRGESHHRQCRIQKIAQGNLTASNSKPASDGPRQWVLIEITPALARPIDGAMPLLAAPTMNAENNVRITLLRGL